MNTIQNFFQRVLRQAMDDHATDIHFEPFEESLEIRYRKDGMLIQLPSFPLQLKAPLAVYLKTLANLNAYNSLQPQDGRLMYDLGETQIDFRISCLPTGFGESIVLRVLNQVKLEGSLKELTMGDELVSQLKKMIQLPSGLFIVAGPTGAGKTTTLYTLLREINALKKKIITVEDPVEYPLSGVTQIQIHSEIGLTFPLALKKLLRHDPDIIMIGEVRDSATAQIAVQAALTGHLVLTTLHATDVASAIMRLLDLKVEAFLLACALKGVLAQRLVRKKCTDCANPYNSSDSNGCPQCHGTGFVGRQGIFQFVPIMQFIAEGIVKNVTSQDLEKLLYNFNMPTLKACALAAVARNETTFKEVASLC